MTAVAQTSGATFYAALSSFAMEFGVVPSGVEDDVVVFGTLGEPQAELQPLINADGTWEDTPNISGFPPIEGRREGADSSFDDSDLGDFQRDWLGIAEMMNRPVRALVLGLDLKAGERDERISDSLVPRDDSGWFEIEEGILPSHELPEPDMRGLELLTVRDMLGMLGNGSVNVGRVREIGAYLYARGIGDEWKEFSANLFFAAGVLAARIGEEKLATMSIERAAARIPEDHKVGRAILYEMAADINETPSGRVAAARQWLSSMIADRDVRTIGIRSLHAMWNAWSVGDLALMTEIMSVYMIFHYQNWNKGEAARSLMRMAWFESERLRRDEGDDAQYSTGAGVYTYLDIATSLFVRMGDGKNAGRAAKLADMLVSRKRGNRVA